MRHHMHRHRSHFLSRRTKKDDRNENTDQITSEKINGSAILSVTKYAYLIAFFALLSGIFYPFIQGGTVDYTILGIIILFVGLAGTILVYKAATSDKKRGIYIGIGFGLVAVSFFYILSFTGRPLA